MNEVDMICAAIGVSVIVLGFVLWRLVRVRPTVIGSELDRRWADVEHASMKGTEHIGSRSVMDLSEKNVEALAKQMMSDKIIAENKKIWVTGGGGITDEQIDALKLQGGIVAPGRAYTGGSIAETHLGPIHASKPILARADHGQFGTGNRPANAGTSKQIERLHLAGGPHASAVAMIDADCTQQERRVIHMREHGDSLTLIAQRLGVSVGKVRRLEVKAVNKILAAREKP